MNTRVFTVLLGLSVIMGACYWQPDGRETNLAIEANVPNLLASGGVGAQQTFSGDGMLYVYVIEESYLLLSPQELDNLFEALEDAQSLSQEELDARYPAARIRTLPINFALGTAGSVALTGLKGNATYVVAVFAEACEGTYLGDYDCDGTWHEAMDFRRRTLPAGETTRVSLRLDDNFQAFNEFLFDQYGFVSEEDWDLEPGDFGFYRVFETSPITMTAEYVGNTVPLVFSEFAWEYRGSFFDGTEDLYRYHLWWYDNSVWTYNRDSAYSCDGAANCAQAAGRLSGTGDGAFAHAVIYSSTGPEGPTTGTFEGANLEFVKLYLSDPVNPPEELNDAGGASIELSASAPGIVEDAVIQAVFPDVTLNPTTIELVGLIELP